MDRPLEHSMTEASTKPSGFVPYTVFPALEHTLERQLGPSSKFQLSQQQRDSFVRFLPWVALLFLPLQLGGVMVLLGVSAVAKLMGAGSIIPALLSTLTFVLDVIALPGLFSGKRKGWAFFTYALAVGVVSKLISFSLFGLLVSALLFWLAFQVKYHYR